MVITLLLGNLAFILFPSGLTTVLDHRLHPVRAPVPRMTCTRPESAVQPTYWIIEIYAPTTDFQFLLHSRNLTLGSSFPEWPEWLRGPDPNRRGIRQKASSRELHRL